MEHDQPAAPDKMTTTQLFAELDARTVDGEPEGYRLLAYPDPRQPLEEYANGLTWLEVAINIHQDARVGRYGKGRNYVAYAPEGELDEEKYVPRAPEKDDSPKRGSLLGRFATKVFGRP